jgi:hypothetical protein
MQDLFDVLKLVFYGIDEYFVYNAPPPGMGFTFGGIDAGECAYEDRVGLGAYEA